MQEVKEREQLDLWDEFWKNDHKTKIERLDLDCFSSKERACIKEKASEVERLKERLNANYISFKAIKSGTKVILHTLIQIEV